MNRKAEEQQESLDLARYRADLPDDREEYKRIMKSKGGKTYKRIVADAEDDREEYKRRKKRGKKKR